MEKRPSKKKPPARKKPVAGGKRQAGKAPGDARPLPFEKFRRDKDPAPVEKNLREERPAKKAPRSSRKTYKPSTPFNKKLKPAPASFETLDGPVRLNKYVAHCGVSARRQAAEYVKQGLVTVNGQVEKNPGYLVQPDDEVKFKGKRIKPEERKVYILMNKPKDVITTASDEKGRKTVLEIVGKKVKERIFPVGRLDRMTTGLLLLTNDGDLAKKLSHPSHKVAKFYLVTLNKPLHQQDLEKIRKGIELEDGIAQVDGIDYVHDKKDEIGVELHIGKNRIIRRILEHLGYQVIRLDRTYYAGLTKKDLGRGHFRHLTEREVIMLKHFK